MTTLKSGYVAIVGRPNVGKSTLLNHLLGKKISITSAKPQTTRWQILGIKTIAEAQIIYIDTPGLHQEAKKAVNRYMNRAARAAIADADVIVFMIDAGHWHKEDQLVWKALQDIGKPIVLALNKIDLLKDKSQLLPFIERLKEKIHFVQLVPLSALKGKNIDALEQEITHYLPIGPAFYPADQITDKSISFQTAEIIREKLIRVTGQELPYTTTIEIEHFKEEEKLTDISAIIWVERSGQKIIVIGEKGQKLKKIGTEARHDLENLLERKVFLRLWVKVKAKWTDDEKALRGLGYV